VPVGKEGKASSLLKMSSCKPGQEPSPSPAWVLPSSLGGHTVNFLLLDGSPHVLHRKCCSEEDEGTGRKDRNAQARPGLSCVTGMVALQLGSSRETEQQNISGGKRLKNQTNFLLGLTAA